MAADSSTLKVTVEEPSSFSRRLSIVVPADRVQRTRTAVSSQFARNARLPGFRKGKLPTRVIEQRFGPSIDQEMLDRLIQESYREALDTEGFTPISQGQVGKVDYQPGQDFTFEVEFEVQPEIEIENTSGFEVEREAIAVGDEDVDTVLERLRDDQAEWDEVEAGEHPAAGDRTSVEITALDADDETAEPHAYRIVLGDGQAIPDVEAAIMTLASGEEGEFDITFPEDFPDEDRKGETQRLRIRLEAIQRKRLPELNDEFAKGVGDFDSVDALRTRIREDLERDAEQRSESGVRQELVRKIVEANPFDVPESMIARYLDHMTGHAHGDGADEHEHSPEELERIEKVRGNLRPQAEWALRRMMLVDRIAEKEGLQATQDDIDARVDEIAERHGRSPSEVWITLEKSGQLEQLEREIVEDRVFDHLKQGNTIR